MARKIVRLTANASSSSQQPSQDVACRYKIHGCGAMLSPDPTNVANHEQHCYFRAMSCKVENCTWAVTLNKFITHYQQDHKELLIVEDVPFEINLTCSYNTVRVFKIDDKFLMVSWKFNFATKTLEYMVENYNTSKKQEYNCVLTLKHQLKDTRFLFESDVRTNISYHDVLQGDSATTEIYAEFNIILPDCIQKFSNKFVRSEENLKQLSILKCTKCGLFAMPPIAETYSNTILCSPCQKKACSKMRDNPFLTDYANLLVYPCEFSKDGCLFAASPSVLQQHYESCALKQSADYLYALSKAGPSNYS